MAPATGETKRPGSHLAIHAPAALPRNILLHRPLQRCSTTVLPWNQQCNRHSDTRRVTDVADEELAASQARTMRCLLYTSDAADE